MLRVKFCLFQLGKPSVLFLDPPVHLPSRSWWFGCSSYVPLASSISSSSVCGFQSGLTLQTRPWQDGRARFLALIAATPIVLGRARRCSSSHWRLTSRRFTCLILNLVSLCGFQPLQADWQQVWVKETMVVCRSVAALPSVRPHKLLGEVPAPHRSACGISGDRKQMDIYIFFFMVWIVLKGKHMQYIHLSLLCFFVVFFSWMNLLAVWQSHSLPWSNLLRQRLTKKPQATDLSEGVCFLTLYWAPSFLLCWNYCMTIKGTTANS